MFCSICLEDSKSYTVRMDGCDHHHCFSCFAKWSKEKQSCPMCRNENDAAAIYNSSGMHIKDCPIRILKQIPECACPVCVTPLIGYMECPICFQEIRGDNVCIVGCNHHHCVNCMVDYRTCRVCGNRRGDVLLFSADEQFLTAFPISNLRKSREDVWLDLDEEEQF